MRVYVTAGPAQAAGLLTAPNMFSPGGEEVFHILETTGGVILHFKILLRLNDLLKYLYQSVFSHKFT